VIDYEVVKNWWFDDIRYSYCERDCILYPLAVGFGGDPLSPGELRYTYEKNLRAVPSMAGIMSAPGVWWGDSRSGADATKLGSQLSFPGFLSRVRALANMPPARPRHAPA
jgi:hypothetical protein